ncbi:MAG: aldo/keto reductase [Methylocella sp.]
MRVVLEKLTRRETLTDDNLQLLFRQIAELERRAQDRQGKPACNALLADAAEVRAFVSGHATRDGTERIMGRSGKGSIGFYRAVQDICLSSVGIGTFRGAIDAETDASYAAAVHAALGLGVNIVDTSLNYRQQHSERAVGTGLRRHFEMSGGRRDEIVVCTKGGYLVAGAVTPGTLEAEEIVSGTHSMAPSFLSDQIDRSRRNLGLETIDVYYLHNPEVQLRTVDVKTFMARIGAAFEKLEGAVSDGLIRYYGTATWNGYRDGTLALSTLAEIARRIAGENHHFRFVQMPFNLCMQEAIRPLLGFAGSFVDLAAELGIAVIASAPLLQGRLSRDLPHELAKMLPALVTDCQRAIQFARSAPGITSALVGMRTAEHVADSLRIAGIAPLTPAEYKHLQSAGF